MNIRVLGFMVSFFQMGCTVFGIRTVEEPRYKVVRQFDDLEVRQYDPYLVATTKVKGPFSEAQNAGFRILANYIFGGNTTETSIAMTAPVIRENDGESIAMTAPVLQSQDAEGWLVSFTMPSQYKSLKDLPKPLDNRVELKRVEGYLAGVIGYTWRGTAELNKEMADKLLTWLAKEGYQLKGNYKMAGYDPPWTIPFLRKNEIIQEVVEP